MEKGNKLYIKLFDSLSKEDRNEVIKILKDNIEEKFSNSFKCLDEYCNSPKCDIVAALSCWYHEIYGMYIYSYSENYFESKIIFSEREDFKNFLKENKWDDKEIESLLEIISHKKNKEQKEWKMYKNDNLKRIGINYIAYEFQNINLLKSISNKIKEIGLERRKNPSKYKVEKEMNLDEEFEYKKYMYMLHDPDNVQFLSKSEIKHEDNINIEALKEYFKLQFKQQDVDSSNFDTLINDLRGGLPSYTQNDITAIASIIYNSNKLHSSKKPATFNKWLKAFCFMINRDVPTSKPSGVKKQIKNLSGTFYYITNE